MYRERPPSRRIGSEQGSSVHGLSAQGSAMFTRRRAISESDWNSCVSGTYDSMSSRDYPPSLRGAPYHPPAMCESTQTMPPAREYATSKATQMMPPARDRRWGIMRRQRPMNGNLANHSPEATATSPVIRNPLDNQSPGIQRHVRPPTTGGPPSREMRPSEGQEATRSGGDPMNTKNERHGIRNAHQVREVRIEEGEAPPPSAHPMKEHEMPFPPAHGSIPADRDQTQNVRGNEMVARQAPRIPGQDGDTRNREGVPPPVCTGRRGRSHDMSEKTTSADNGGNFAVATRASGNVRTRAECVAQREEARPHSDENAIPDARRPHRPDRRLQRRCYSISNHGAHLLGTG